LQILSKKKDQVKGRGRRNSANQSRSVEGLVDTLLGDCSDYVEENGKLRGRKALLRSFVMEERKGFFVASGGKRTGHEQKKITAVEAGDWECALSSSGLY